MLKYLLKCFTLFSLLTILLHPAIEDYEGLLIESIEVKGNVNEPVKRIKAYIELEQGDPVNVEVIRRNFKDIYTSGIFESSETSINFFFFFSRNFFFLLFLFICFNICLSL